VSVIIPTHNRLRTLPRAIESVLAQDYPVHEIIVVDDRSTDGTPEFLAAQSRVSVLTNARNLGAQGSRNRGIAAARGDLIAFLDSDDIWKPEKLRRQVDAAGERDEVCVTCGYRQFGASGGFQHVPPEEIRLETAFVHNVIGPTSNILISRSLIEAVGVFDPAMPSCQDWEFFVRVLERQPILGIPDVLTFQDTGSGNRISNNHDRVVAGHQMLYRRARATRAFSTLSLAERTAVRARQEFALLKRTLMGASIQQMKGRGAL
jgi:glycosyltransferase involved in cell wall biosynthesis